MKTILNLLLLFAAANVFAQDSLTVEGYAYETDNRGFLREVRVKAYVGDTLYATSQPTDKSGKFVLRLPSQPNAYKLVASRQAFHDKSTEIAWTLPAKDPVIYTKIELERLPGYLLEVSITDFVQSGDNTAAYGIEGATIEVYNYTMQREELRLVAHPKHIFSVFLEQGNEYIFMLRKDGYYTKRLRANINVNGCILCMEGFGTVTPGVVENLTQNNTKGILLTSVAMKKLLLNETVAMPNIYYDVGKSNLRPEALPQLDQLAELLKDNPQVSIELSSHTDCRGSNRDNQSLSQSRAEAVVRYLLNRAPIQRSRVTAKGYGESRPVNSCVDGVECSEEAYQQNRRTEFTVTEIRLDDPYKERTLAGIMQEENMERQLAAVKETYVDEVVPVKPTTETKTVQAPQALPFQYTGFKIELTRRHTSPDMNDPIFKAFEPVYLDMANGMIVFLVGNYTSRADAEKELTKIKAQYPKALVAEFAQGVRK